MPVATASVLLRKGNTRNFGFPGGSAVKNPRAVQETLQTLGQEDPLEKDMATHSSIFAWRIHMDRGARRATVHRVTKSPTQLSDIAQHPRLIHKRK